MNYRQNKYDNCTNKLTTFQKLKSKMKRENWNGQFKSSANTRFARLRG